MMKAMQYVLLGLAAGTLSGIVGIGGGIVLVPVLVYVFAFSQLQAQGTTLAALVPPIGLLAAWMYYREGHVRLEVAAFLCIGFFFGGLLGAKVATKEIPVDMLRKLFGIVLTAAGLYTILTKAPKVV